MWFVAAVAAALLVQLRSCRNPFRRTPPSPSDPALVLATGYCNCGRCCGWERRWFGLFGPPVYSYGRMKGRPKAVGVTASGTTARRGTIAADPSVFPFGTVLDVPGYGRGTVEDVGGAIKGRHVDLWFPTHAEARRWGARWLRVGVRRQPRAGKGKRP